MVLKNNLWNWLDWKINNYVKLHLVEVEFDIMTHNEKVLTTINKTYNVSALDIVFDDYDSFKMNNIARYAMSKKAVVVSKDAYKLLAEYQKSCEFLNAGSIFKVLKTHIIGIKWDINWGRDGKTTSSVSYQEFLDKYDKEVIKNANN